MPILVSIGANFWGTPEYRFGHLSYQEYLTGREYYQRLTVGRFSTATVAAYQCRGVAAIGSAHAASN